MFSGCEKLAVIPSFTVTDWIEAAGCFDDMFAGCISLDISETKHENHDFSWRIDLLAPTPEPEPTLTQAPEQAPEQDANGLTGFAIWALLGTAGAAIVVIGIRALFAKKS